MRWDRNTAGKKGKTRPNEHFGTRGSLAENITPLWGDPTGELVFFKRWKTLCPACFPSGVSWDRNTEGELLQESWRIAVWRFSNLRLVHMSFNPNVFENTKISSPKYDEYQFSGL